jgi:hypothetical protein
VWPGSVVVVVVVVVFAFLVGIPMTCAKGVEFYVFNG